jgi:hypothetical protein
LFDRFVFFLLVTIMDSHILLHIPFSQMTTITFDCCFWRCIGDEAGVVGVVVCLFVTAMMAAAAVSKATARIFLPFFCSSLTRPFSLSRPSFFYIFCWIVDSVLLALPVQFLAAVSKATAAAVSKTSQKVRLIVCCFLVSFARLITLTQPICISFYVSLFDCYFFGVFVSFRRRRGLFPRR